MHGKLFSIFVLFIYPTTINYIVDFLTFHFNREIKRNRKETKQKASL